MENSPSNIERHTGEPHSGLQDEVMSIEKKLKYTVVGIGVLTGLFFLGRRLIRKEKKANADGKSFETGSPEAISSQIRLALENKNRIGINLTQLRQILIGIPSKSQMQAIRTAYFNQYQKLMNDDIKSKISLSEFDELLAIMDGKPEKSGSVPTSVQYKAWARRMDAAFRKTFSVFPDTDKEAITAVFVEVPSQQAFIEVGKSYNTQFKPKDFITELKSELGSDYLKYMKIITTKRKK